MARKKVDATSGPLVKLIFIYTIPLILSTILQNCFNIADKAVLGNMAGSTAVASIGATGSATSLVINGALGLSTGTAIILARYVGQKDLEKIRSTINTSIISALVLGSIVAIAGFFLAPVFLTVTKCPIECYEGALIYVRIYLAGAPATLLYNYGSAILRTIGDTQRPLYYITVAGVVNVVLNVILCLILPQKVMAVAIATITSKIISSALVVWRLSHFGEAYDLDLRRMRFHFPTFKQIMRFGIPSSISNIVLPLGNLQIVTAINSFGVDAIAGNSAAVSVHSIAASFSGGFGSATATFLGQNIGAKNPERVRKSFWYLLGLNILITGSLGVVMYLTGRFWIGVILGASAGVAIDYGMRRMFFVTLFSFIAATNKVLSHALQAFGYPMFTSISNIAFTLGFRVLWMQTVFQHSPTYDIVMACFTVSWSLNLLLYAIFFAFVYRRYIKKGICKKI